MTWTPRRCLRLELRPSTRSPRCDRATPDGEPVLPPDTAPTLRCPPSVPLRHPTPCPPAGRYERHVKRIVRKLINRVNSDVVSRLWDGRRGAMPEVPTTRERCRQRQQKEQQGCCNGLRLTGLNDSGWADARRKLRTTELANAVATSRHRRRTWRRQRPDNGEQFSKAPTASTADHEGKRGEERRAGNHPRVDADALKILEAK